MSIRAKIPGVRTFSTSVSDIDRIRIASPAFAIKPSLELEQFTDVTTVGATDDDILVYFDAIKKFSPAEPTDVIAVDTIFGGSF